MKGKEKIFTGNISNTPTKILHDALTPANLELRIGSTQEWFALWINGSKHSNRIISLDAKQIHAWKLLDPGIDGIVVDGILEIQNTIYLLLLTADCAPIGVSSRNGNLIGLFHGGWQGIAWDIIWNFDAIIKMKWVPRKDVYVQIWPMIWEDYEFQETDIRAHFQKIVDIHGLSLQAYIKEKHGKHFLLLGNLIKDIFLALGYDKTQIQFHRLSTNQPTNSLPSHRLHTTAKRLVSQISTESFRTKIWDSMYQKIFGDEKQMTRAWWTLSQRKSVAIYLDANDEEKIFFMSPEFEFYVQATRMTTIVSN